MAENKIFLLIVLIISSLSSYLLYNSYQHVQDTYSTTQIAIDLQQEKQIQATNMYQASRERGIIMLNMLNEDDAFILDDLNQALSAQAQKFIIARRAFSQLQLSAEELKLLDIQNTISAKNAETQRMVADLLISGKQDEAKALFLNQTLARQNTVQNYLNKFIISNANQMNTAIKEIAEGIKDSGNNLVLLGILMLGSGLLFIIILLTRATKKEYQHLEKELQAHHKSERLLSRLTNQQHAFDHHSIVAITDIKGTITYVNSKFCDISGYSKEELIGQNHRILNSSNQSKEYWKKMFARVSNGQVWHDEIRNKAKDGTLYWVDTTIVPITWDSESSSNNTAKENNKIKGYISIRTDISASKAQEQKLLSAKISAEAATLAKSNFLSTMSHEIRTPMNGVIGMTQLLEDTPLNELQRDYLGTISRSGNNLLSIINDILDFSKLDANMTDLEKIPFDLERIFQESLELMAGNAINKDIEFILDYQPECPRHFIGDPSRIRQVLINIIGNAVKFTETGYIRLAASFEKTNHSSVNLCIAVQDTGIGLKEEALEHLFDQFTQADNSTTREYGGTGLGLAITKRIINLMDGNIIVDSIYGEGTTFKINTQLPLAPAPPPLVLTPLKGMKILFIDKHKENSRVFKRMLDHMGASTTLEPDTRHITDILEQAITLKKPYQFIILDDRLTPHSGLEIGKEIRQFEQFNNLKLIIFSSIGQKGDAALFSRAGFDAYLSKLCSYQTLHAMLSQALEHKAHQPIITQHSINESANISNQVDTEFNAKILLVEDVLPNQIIAKTFLTKMGIEVDVANNGQEAIDAFVKNDYDLILMDCRMPVLDGYQASKTIRDLETAAESQAIPIIALTANASSDDRELCHHAGMNDFITKPFKRNDLSQCLKRWLNDSDKTTKPSPSKEPQAPKNLSTLDKEVYNNFIQDMGEDAQAVVISILDSISSSLKNIDQLSGTETEAESELTRHFHSIKSPANTLGALKLADIADSAENSLRNKQKVSIKDTTVLIKQELDKLQKHLNQL